MSELIGIDLDPEDFASSIPLKKVPYGDVYEPSRAGDVDRLKYLLESARMLLESGAICSEHMFDGDRCHYAALNLKVRKLLKAFEARPPPLGPSQAAVRETFWGVRLIRLIWSNWMAKLNFQFQV
ncbi:BTB/POZ domain-containing protein At2g04740-like [Coffea eugenioides]|uniref:BTB/POZ domain-containing protein At2g04740-like n=1 Tax=Coffea eugenioides TaxID=49369 RepID=UPI000F612229|nr:BTB/POZ domain-containing protein At2g04740-like [Coffea eugenioides]